MIRNEVPGLTQFLQEYPRMALRPSATGDLVLKGNFGFTARSKAYGEISETYALSIVVPRTFPKAIPTVTEVGGKIPRSLDFHVNSNGTLCLGSPLRLLIKLSTKPTITGFVESCLIPYLFAISIKIRTGGGMVFDELAHGLPGMINDYSDILGLKKSEQVKYAISLLGKKKRLANKKPCPCSCGLRLGKCRFNRKIAELRRIAPRWWYSRQFYLLSTAKTTPSVLA